MIMCVTKLQKGFCVVDIIFQLYRNAGFPWRVLNSCKHVACVTIDNIFATSKLQLYVYLLYFAWADQRV